LTIIKQPFIYKAFNSLYYPQMGFTTLFNIQNNMQMQCNYRNVLYTYILKRNKYFDTILIEFTRKYLKTKLAYYLLTKILKRNVNRQKGNGYLPSLIAKSQIKADLLA